LIDHSKSLVLKEGSHTWLLGIPEEFFYFTVKEDMTRPSLGQNAEDRDGFAMRQDKDSCYQAEVAEELAELLDALEEQVIHCIAALEEGVLIADLILPLEFEDAYAVFTFRNCPELSLRFLCVISYIVLLLFVSWLIVVLFHLEIDGVIGHIGLNSKGQNLHS
jgi:hypothetical protein